MRARRLSSCGLARPVLIAIFALTFGIPVLSVWLYVRGAPTNSELLITDLEQRAQRVDGSGPRVIIRQSGEINPRDDKDLLMFATMRFRSLPPIGERVVLFSKTPASNAPAGVRRGPEQGFAVALVNDQGVYRFMLSWPAEDGSRWMRFSEIAIDPEQWFVFGLAMRAQGHIGAFYLPIERNRARPPRLIVLGGFSVEKSSAAASNAPLILAPGGAGRYISRIGPFGVLRSSQLGGKEGDILRDLAGRAEFLLPNLVSRNQVALFWGGGTQAVGTDDQQLFSLDFERR